MFSEETYSLVVWPPSEKVILTWCVYDGRMQIISGECNQFLEPDPYWGVPVENVEICLKLIAGTSAA
jgi:hypothetical protein